MFEQFSVHRVIHIRQILYTNRDSHLPLPQVRATRSKTLRDKRLQVWLRLVDRATATLGCCSVLAEHVSNMRAADFRYCWAGGHRSVVINRRFSLQRVCIRNYWFFISAKQRSEWRWHCFCSTCVCGVHVTVGVCVCAQQTGHSDQFITVKATDMHVPRNSPDMTP